MFGDKSLATRKTVEEMTSAYNSALEKFRRGYELLEEAEKELINGFGNDYGFSTIDRYSIQSNAKANFEHVKSNVKKSAWRIIVGKLGIKKLLSIKRAEEFDKKLEDANAMPEITDINIYEMIETLRQQATDYAKEAVLEVFETFRVGKSDNNHFKTNKKNARFDLGEKIILEDAVEGNYFYTGQYKVISGRNENNLTALDKVFYLLDGKTPPENYKSPLIDAINTSPDGKGETDYFSFVAHKNRNLHLTFKRMDLVTKINQLAGNPAELKGQEPKQARKWANPFTVSRMVKNELKIDLYSILYHQEFWPENLDKTYHTFLVAGFEKNEQDKRNTLIFITGMVDKQGQISDLFVIDTIKTAYGQDMWKSDIEKAWETALESFIVG